MSTRKLIDSLIDWSYLAGGNITAATVCTGRASRETTVRTTLRVTLLTTQTNHKLIEQTQNREATQQLPVHISQSSLSTVPLIILAMRKLAVVASESRSASNVVGKMNSGDDGSEGGKGQRMLNGDQFWITRMDTECKCKLDCKRLFYTWTHLH